MKRLRIYVWFAAFVFLANAWLSHVFSSQKIYSSEQLPVWHNALTHIALISQLPSLALSKIIADWFGVSYSGWALATSVISIVIYFPLIELARPWRVRVNVTSIWRKVSVFSSSLNPCVPARKGSKIPTLILEKSRVTHTMPETAQAVAKLSSNTLDFVVPSSVAPPPVAPSHTLIGS